VISMCSMMGGSTLVINIATMISLMLTIAKCEPKCSCLKNHEKEAKLQDALKGIHR
jgi:hypothetical protein